MFKVNNKDTRTWRRSGVFIANFKHISHFVLCFIPFATMGSLMTPYEVTDRQMLVVFELLVLFHFFQ